VFALLELYKRGEAWWEQDESFGDIAVHASAGAGSEATVTPLRAHAGGRAG
jgi:chromatin segregation and condensation protein Rec8/ScpA/Scc1 (kleisin family)